MIRNIVFTSLLAALAVPALAAESEPEVLFATHCAVCHGDDRLGALGPALIPEALRRLKGERLHAVIANGRDATQMPGFGDQIAPEDIEILASYLHTPLPEIPVWDAAKIESTLVVNEEYVAPVGPQHAADPLNLFVVVETGDHHISILDGDRMEVLARLYRPILAARVAACLEETTRRARAGDTDGARAASAAYQDADLRSRALTQAIDERDVDRTLTLMAPPETTTAEE